MTAGFFKGLYNIPQDRQNRGMLISAIIKQYRRMNLLVGISCGIVIGVVLALLVPQASFIALLGTIFVGALKAIAPILVFVLVISSLANAQQTPGKRFRTVIILYLASTLLAAVAAVFASRLFPVTLTLTHGVDDLTPPSDISEVFKKILENCVSNPVASIVNANYIGILFWAIVLSILATLSACGASGVAGGSLLLIPMACSLFGIPNDVGMQVVGVGFIIGVVQDSFETAINSSADVIFAAAAEFSDWRKQGREINF